MTDPRKLPLPKDVGADALPTFVPSQRGIPIAQQPERRLPGGSVAVIVDPETGVIRRDRRHLPEGSTMTEGPMLGRTLGDRLRDVARVFSPAVQNPRTMVEGVLNTRAAMGMGPTTPTPGSEPRSVPLPNVVDEEFHGSLETIPALARLLTAVRAGQITSNEALDLANNMGLENTESFLVALQRSRQMALAQQLERRVQRARSETRE